MPLSTRDRETLRQLAARYSEIAHLDIQKERIERYYRTNALESVRPVVLIDEVPWGEIKDSALTNVCAPELGWIESRLRQTLYQWEHFQVDRVVPRDAREPWNVVWFVFKPRPDWFPLLDLPEEFPRFSRLPLAGRKHAGLIRRALLLANRFAGIASSSGQALAMNAIERALLWLQVEFATTSTRLDPRVQAAMELFTRRLSEPPAIPEAAAACGVSSSRLGGLFLAATGQSPRAWLEQVRLQHARDLLATTGMPVKLVAAACGYKDQRHFATRFRRHFGMTPGHCRRQAGHRGHSKARCQ